MKKEEQNQSGDILLDTPNTDLPKNANEKSKKKSKISQVTCLCKRQILIHLKTKTKIEKREQIQSREMPL